MTQYGKYRCSSSREGDRVQTCAPAINFDITSDVKYESLRNQSRHGRLYRQHQDLTRECARQVKSYELGQKLFVLEFKRHKKKFENRLAHLISKSETNTAEKCSTSSYCHQWSLTQPTQQPIKMKGSPAVTGDKRDTRTTLLFRVLHRDGEDIYTDKQIDRFKHLGPPKALGQSRDDFHIGLRRPEAARPPPRLVRELTM